MNRFTCLIASSLFALSLTAACGGGTNVAQNPSPPEGGDAAIDTGAISCATTPLAKDQDHTCKTDADCTWAPPGGDPCKCAGEETWCKTAPISLAGSEAFINAVQDAHRNAFADSCGTSCPAILAPPTCCAGTCTIKSDCHQ